MKNKERIWTIWFSLSILAFLVLIFVGMLDNSINDYPNWPYFVIATVVNLLAAIKVGLLPISDDEK